MYGMKVSQVARQAGVNVTTVRYYERHGLIPEPTRLISGYRQYSQETVKRIRFIKNAQALGFSLKEIAELLSLRVKDEETCSMVRMKAEKKIAEIESKMDTLRKIKEVLLKLIAACETRATSDECPILQAFAP